MTLATSETPANRRGAPRQRVLLGGRLVHGTSDFTQDCRVQNLSDAGARIVVSEGVLNADDVCLIVVRDGVAHEANLVWSRAGSAGLRFRATHDLGQAVPSRLNRVKRLWADVQPR